MLKSEANEIKQKKSNISTNNYYQFNKACEIFEQLPVTNFLEIMKQYSNCMNETEQNYQSIQLKELAEFLDEDKEMNVNETKAVLHFLESFSTSGRIDCRKLFVEFEKSRSQLLDVTEQKFINKQMMIPNKHRRSENVQLKLPQEMKLQQLNDSTPKFTSQVSRRAFRVVNNDDRILNYHFILNQSQTVCIMCELLTNNDQPADRNYKNDIYVVLYDTIEEQVITVTMKALEDKYVSEECLLKAGEYIVNIQTSNCLECSNMSSTSYEMELVDSNGKLTKHFKLVYSSHSRKRKRNEKNYAKLLIIKLKIEVFIAMFM
ncbi:unnamed protein product [Onchocerca flexuosa]|uniref:EF-hand domain-containing protein n=1 Tax=Onchocerca flexuosa TaxID=387005 RepID=A0A183H804_9BILA|nr:unnamed protein product [Onchocerca flexuosa]